jgi:hypothetical protein
MGFPSIERAAATAGVVLAATVFSAAASAQALVRGVLYDDATGRPVRGTVMLVDPASNGAVVHTVSDSLGQFALKTSGGRYQIAAVRAGYTGMLSAPVQLQSGESMTIRIPIAQGGDPSHHIAVLEHIRPDRATAERPGLGENEAFARHKLLGTGRQFDRAALASSNATSLGEFLENVAGVSVGDPNSTQSMRMTRSSGIYGSQATAAQGLTCRIGWFVDGRRMDRVSPDAITDGLGSTPLNVLEGVEVFRGISELPPEFAEPDLRCGAVALWTRRN